MLLTIEKHFAYRVYDKEENQVPRLQEFDTKSCLAKQVRYKDGTAVLDEENNLIIDTITIEGGYAVDPGGNKAA